jgi:formate C-acetyltransferase
VAYELAKEGVELNEAAIRAIYQEVTTANSLDPTLRARYREIKRLIDETCPKYGNDIYEADMFARDVANTYTKEVEKYKNPRGGVFQAGLYPVSANVPLGGQTGATPDGRLAHTPIADGIGPASGRDKKGPTATANSVAKLEQCVASNGTLLNQKFHPSALSGMSGLTKFVALIRSYFDQKGMHMQFNVVTRETLLDAQKNPEKYKTLVVRVAGYSALFTTLSRSLQDDIINRTEQGF